MDKKRTERTNSFEAHDASGKKFRIHEFTEIHEYHSTSGLNRVEGRKALKLEDSTDVNYEGPGRYRAIGVREFDLFADVQNPT